MPVWIEAVVLVVPDIGCAAFSNYGPPAKGAGQPVAHAIRDTRSKLNTDHKVATVHARERLLNRVLEFFQLTTVRPHPRELYSATRQLDSAKLSHAATPSSTNRCSR